MLAAADVYGNIGDFQRSYIYKIFIETVPDAILKEFPQATTIKERIDLYNTKAIFPDMKTSKIKQSWGGEFFYISGVDESTREGDIEFFNDEPKWIYDFFKKLKAVTGNDVNHASVYDPDGSKVKFNIGIAEVSVDKETIRNYRRLKGVRVFELDCGDYSKDGTEISKIRVNIAWDKNEEDESMRGLTV